MSHDDIMCSYCHKIVSFFAATFEDGLPYHDHCYRFHLSRDLAAYEKKARKGTLMVNETKEMEDLQYRLDVARQSSSPPDPTKNQHRVCQKSGFGFLDSSNFDYVRGEYVTVPLMRIECSRSVLEANHKRLYAANAESRAWNIFNLLESQKLLCDNYKDKTEIMPVI